MPGDFQRHVKDRIQVYVKQQQGVWFNNAPSPQSSEGVGVEHTSTCAIAWETSSTSW